MQEDRAAKAEEDIKIPDEGKMFTAELGGRNHVPGRRYWFLQTSAEKTSGNYQDVMIETCKQYNMQPVCDHKSYCRNDYPALYIGQDHHIAHGGHQNNNGYFPSGWNEIKAKFDGYCMYSAAGNGNHALCQPHAGHGGHHWQTAAQTNKFMCGSITDPMAAAGAAVGDPEYCLGCAEGYLHFK